MSYDGYVAGSFKTLGSEAGKSPQTAANEQVFQRARANLWKALKGLKMKAGMGKGKVTIIIILWLCA